MNLPLASLVIPLALAGCALAGCALPAPVVLSSEADPGTFSCSVSAAEAAGYVVEDVETGVFFRAAQGRMDGLVPKRDVLTVTVTSGRLRVVADGEGGAPTRRAREEAEAVVSTCGVSSAA